MRLDHLLSKEFLYGSQLWALCFGWLMSPSVRLPGNKCCRVDAHLVVVGCVIVGDHVAYCLLVGCVLCGVVGG